MYIEFFENIGECLYCVFSWGDANVGVAMVNGFVIERSFG